MDASERVAVELEHAIGFTGSILNSILFHPNGEDYVYIAGGTVVVANVNDPHNQSFLRGHDDNVTCIDISKSVSCCCCCLLSVACTCGIHSSVGSVNCEWSDW